MKKVALASALALCAISTVAEAKKDKNPPSGLELQQIQSRDIDGSKEAVFGAVMSVLQDAGYRIQAADKDTGLITGIASTKSKMVYSLWSGFGKSKKSPIVSAFVEQRTPTTSRVRLNFVMAKVKSSLYGSQPQDEEPIYDAVVYQDAFEKINQAVFIRMGTEAPAAGAQAAGAPSPSSGTVTPVATSAPVVVPIEPK